MSRRGYEESARSMETEGTQHDSSVALDTSARSQNKDGMSTVDFSQIHKKKRMVH